MAREKASLGQRLDYLFGGASPRRAAGTALALAGAKLNWPGPCAKPWMVQVEVTNRCNLNCAFCSRSVEDMTLGDMRPELRDRVVELTANAQEVALFGYGEPLLSKAFYALLPRLRCSRVGFFTNGMLLDARLLEKIVGLSARPLSYVVFSVDGAEAATYETVRGGASFDRVWSNLAGAVELRTRQGWAGPLLRIEFVAMLRNIAELPQLVRMADDIGVDGIKVSHLVVWDEAMRDQSLLYHPELCREAFEAAASEAASRRIWLDLPKIPGQRTRAEGEPLPPCRYPWHYAMISFEGEVRACCFAPQFMMGSLRDQPFDAIWNSGFYRSLRRSLNSGEPPVVCLRCEERFRYDPSPDEERTYIKLAPRLK